MIERVAAIVRADVLIRFRRASTIVVFLLLSAFAYVWVPDPATGRTIMQVSGARVLYDSAAIGMATASIGAIFVGLFAFYVISNAVGRDVVTRCGQVIASTRIGTGEYIAGKFLGNVVFLTVFMAGFMVASMAMLVVRGEAPLRPLVFVWQYLVLDSSVVIYVSVVAILFESIPLLSGRFGDVVYFFFWCAAVGVVITVLEKTGSRWPQYLDFTSFGYLFDWTTRVMHTKQLSIGSSSFDASRPPIVMPPLSIAGDMLLPRITSTLAPLLLLPVAHAFFHRFDPARTKAASAHAKRSWLGRINGLLRPPARLLFGRFVRQAAIADAQLTVVATPLIVVAAIVFAVIPTAAMPFAFAAAAILIADVASRERRAGTETLVWAAPRIREHFVAWKMASSVLVALLILAIPIARSSASLPLLAGLFFVCAAVTTLGTVSGNPKTFIVLFLSFWYLCVNDKGATPALDFAGFFGVHPAVSAAYAIAAAAALALTSAFAAARRRG